MPGFTQVFGGSNIYPSQPSYSSINTAVNLALSWAIEQAPAGAIVVTSIMDVTATAPGLSLTLPDARQVSTGFTGLFNNIGANGFSILNNIGGVLVAPIPGSVWQLYLVDNSTAAGVWRVFQFGSAVSTAVAAALAGAGLQAIGNTLNEAMVVVLQNVNYNIVAADLAKVERWTGGVGLFNLPAPATVGANWFVVIKNSGSGNLTVTPAAGLIDGQANLVVAPGNSVWVVTDGNNYFGLAEGTISGGGAFNLVTINIAGSGNFPLSGAQLNQIGYKFIGVLTGNVAVQVPGTAQQYWVDNETTGAFNVTVGTVGQVSPVVVPQGNRYILYCDGANVVNANTAAVVFPITVVQGGTGATTAAAALTNLGGTTVGTGVFTAASIAAAQAALSVPPTTRQIIAGAGLTGGGDLSADRTISTDWVYFIKPANTDRGSNTVYAVDPDLVATGFLANKFYEVEINLCFSEPTGGVGSAKYVLSYNGSLGLNAGTNIGVLVAAAGSLNNNQQTTAVITGVPVGGGNAMPATPGGAGSSVFMKFVYSPIDNSSLSLYWAQNISDASVTRLTKGSHIKYRLLV